MSDSTLTEDEKKADRDRRAAERAAVDALRLAADRRALESFDDRMAEERARNVSATASNEAHVEWCKAASSHHENLMGVIREQTTAFQRIADALEKMTKQP